MTDNIFMKVGDPRPSELSVDPFPSAVIPKPTAWISVDGTVALLEGYNAVSHAPPTLMFAGRALPNSMLKRLQETRLCSLSVASMREQHCLFGAACKDDSEPALWTFDQLGLSPCTEKPTRPPAVQGSPIHMHCRLIDVVDLGSNQQMVLLEVETFVIRKEVLSAPTEQMKSGDRSVLAKIDAMLMRPVASIGGGRFVTMHYLHLMRRPYMQKEWESDPFEVAPDSLGPGGYDDIEYTYRDDRSKLGYNPTKAIVLPRPIGWISTYRDEENSRVPHLAPYSFFTEVGRGDHPMVAFSSYRKSADEEGKKDAQTDAEMTGSFATNMVTADLSVRMNFTSAPLKRQESEFDLSGLSQGKAKLIDAPIVTDSPIVMECRYLKSVDVSSFSIVIGQVSAIRIDANVLTDGRVDVSKLRPVSRLGYTDEYAVVDQLVAPSVPSDIDASASLVESNTPLRPCSAVPSG